MKNQGIVGLGLALILLSFWGNRASGTELISSNFNDDTPQGWVASVTAGSTPTAFTVVAGDSEAPGTSGRYVLQLDDSAASGGGTYATISKAFTAQTNGSLDISFRIRFMDTGTNSQKGDFRLALVGNAGSIYLRMKVSGTGAGFSHYNGSTNQYVPSTITSITVGAWYEVRIAANLLDKTYGWTVRNLSDDSTSQRARVENVAFYQNGNTASALAVVSIQRGGKFQIDDVRTGGFRDNIAKAAPYTFGPSPNYPLCTDSGDQTQLTDGSKRAPGFISPSLWTMPECVGWVNAATPITVNVDLGTIKPISGFGINMCAGTSAGAAWPAHVLAFVSDDGTNWYYLTDLIYTGESANNILSDGRWRETGTRIYKFSSDVQSHGRYVCFSVIPASDYVFSDEVEVYEGNASWLTLPFSGTAVTGLAGVKAYSLDYRIQGGVLKRIKLDENELTNEIETASITDFQKTSLKANLLSAANAARGASLPPAGSFEARVPLNDGHAAMYGIQGALWTSRGVLQPTIWRIHKYQWLEAFNTPPVLSDLSPLSTSILKDEVRGDALLVSNPGSAPIQVGLNVENIVGANGWLKIFKGAWTDTFQRIVVSSALEEIVPVGDTYTFTVPAGMTIRLWLQVDGHELITNSYNGNIRFHFGDTQSVVPWNLRVSLMTLSPARLTTFMWDYLNGGGLNGLNSVNRSQAYSLMQSHLVNSVWGTHVVLPACAATDFNASNQLTGTLDYTALDNWLKNECPGAARYFVYLQNPGTESGSTFAGATMGTPAFTARIGAWIHAIADHVYDQGFDPSKLTILVWDEPKYDWQFQLTTQWLNAIKAGDARLQCFIDPKIDSSTPLSTYSSAIAAADIVCPYTYTYTAAGATLRNYYQQQKTLQKSLFFYLSAGPVKLLDPSYYYRLHAWHVYREGGSGMGYWSIGDIGGTSSSWNEYVATHDNFSPLYLSPTSATTSVHFEALREGVEDNELFSELAESVGTSTDPSIQNRWTALKTRISSQAGTFTSTPRWPQNVDPDSLNSSDSPDKVRLDAIQLLENSHGLFIP